MEIMRVPSSLDRVIRAASFPERNPASTSALHKLRNLSCLGNSLHALLKQATHTQLRLDVGQFEPRTLQPRAPSVGIVRVVVVNAALCRLYPVSCALQVDQGVLARFRARAFFPW